MINMSVVDELERIGFGVDIDYLEEYIIQMNGLKNEGNMEFSEEEYKRCENLLRMIKPESVAFNDRVYSQELHKDNDLKSVGNMEDVRYLKNIYGDLVSDYIAIIAVEGAVVEIEYKNGLIYNAFLKNSDKDVTYTVRKIAPNNIEKWKGYKSVKVIGTLAIRNNEFNKISGWYKKPINAVFDILRTVDEEDDIRCLELVASRCITNGIDNIYEELNELEECGFSVAEHTVYNEVDYYNFEDTVDKIIRYFETKYADNMIDYPSYGIDVLSNLVADNIEFIVRMGKLWENNIYSSKVTSIEWEQGIKYFTPKAKIEPVMTITGVEINEVNLHNAGVLDELDIGVGDEIKFIFSGNNVADVLI